MIKMNLKREGDSDVNGEIFLPVYLSGTFQWKEYKVNLTGGLNRISSD
jgi:hypothetical protein